GPPTGALQAAKARVSSHAETNRRRVAQPTTGPLDPPVGATGTALKTFDILPPTSSRPLCSASEHRVGWAEVALGDDRSLVPSLRVEGSAKFPAVSLETTSDLVCNATPENL